MFREHTHTGENAVRGDRASVPIPSSVSPPLTLAHAHTSPHAHASTRAPILPIRGAQSQQNSGQACASAPDSATCHRRFSDSWPSKTIPPHTCACDTRYHIAHRNHSHCCKANRPTRGRGKSDCVPAGQSGHGTHRCSARVLSRSSFRPISVLFLS